MIIYQEKVVRKLEITNRSSLKTIINLFKSGFYRTQINHPAHIKYSHIHTLNLYRQKYTGIVTLVAISAVKYFLYFKTPTPCTLIRFLKQTKYKKLLKQNTVLLILYCQNNHYVNTTAHSSLVKRIRIIKRYKYNFQYLLYPLRMEDITH